MDDRLEYKGPKTGKAGCQRCNGQGMVLEDISHVYGNRAERKLAIRVGEPMSKWFPCPECCPEGANGKPIAVVSPEKQKAPWSPSGNIITCCKCGRSGGTLRKVNEMAPLPGGENPVVRRETGKYEHVGRCPRRS
jgi:hypothetical protein